MSPETKKYEVLQGVEFPQGTPHEVGAILDLTADDAAGFAEGLIKAVEAVEAAPAAKAFKVLQPFTLRGELTVVDAIVQLSEGELAELAEGFVVAVDAVASVQGAAQETAKTADEVAKTDAPAAEKALRKGTAVKNADGLIKTIFTEDDHGADHAEKAQAFAAQGGFVCEPWEG